ncbi:MAG TPA: hypothetical protein VMU41_10565 [Candidatus Binataceae bacterium]|nr:hypothetical protein [Candidatus Binataceae bacterium]
MRQNEAEPPDSYTSRVNASGQSIEEIDDDDGGNLRRFLMAAAGLAVIVSIAFIGSHFYHRDQREIQANSFGRAFIHDSPVVEEQLGTVERVKKIEEQHQSGNRPGWYLDYDVTGRRASGVVDLRLTPSPNYGVWNVPLAQLDRNHETVALR